MESVKELKERIQELENEISKKIEKQNQVHREGNPSLDIKNEYLNRQQQETKEQEIIRFEKNAAFNISGLPINDQDEYSQKVVRALLVYLSEVQVGDLFGVNVLDPKRFAEKMNFGLDNLNKKCPNPACNAYPNLERRYDTYLENALFILAFRPLVAEFKTTNEKGEKIGLKGINVLDEIYFGEDRINLKGTKKKYYKYKLNEFFEKNLSNYYTKLEINTYNKISKHNADKFYIALKDIYTNKLSTPTSCWYFSLEQLTKLLNISTENTETKHQKQNIKTKLEKMRTYFEKEICGFTMEWVKGDNQTRREKNILKISWDKIENLQTIRKNDKVRIFYQTLKMEYIKKFIEENPDNSLNDDMLFNWLKKQDKDFIVNTYIKTNHQVFCLSEEKIGNTTLNNYAHDFYNILLRENSILEDIIPGKYFL